MHNKQKTETQFVSPLEQQSLEILEQAETLRQEMEPFYERMLQEDLQEEAAQKADSFRRASGNLTRAATQVYAVKDELSGRLRDIRHQDKRKTSAPANAAIDLKEQESGHFARGLNLYKILLIFLIGSFCGVIIEMLWCLLTHGYIESRAGVVYGPLNPLYGIGAVMLTACLYRFRNHGAWISVLGGFLVGSVVEYVCSWGQEFVFGTRSWDYSQMPFNLNGRICLLYSMFWGVLGVLWIKDLYPRMAKLILKLPNKPGRILTWALTAFFVLDMAMSGIAMTRWMQRHEGVEPSNTFWQVIDERFPDERMEKVYANMVFSDEAQ